MTTVPHSGLHLTSRCDLPARERPDWWVVVITICITADLARRKRETCSCMESGSILTTEAHCKSIYWHVARMTYDFCYSREKDEYILVGINTLQITINVRNGRYVLASPSSLIWRMLCGGPRSGSFGEGLIERDILGRYSSVRFRQIHGSAAPIGGEREKSSFREDQGEVSLGCNPPEVIGGMVGFNALTFIHFLTRSTLRASVYVQRWNANSCIRILGPQSVEETCGPC